MDIALIGSDWHHADHVCDVLSFTWFTWQLFGAARNDEEPDDRKRSAPPCLAGLALPIVYWTAHIAYKLIRRLRYTHTEFY